MKPPLLTIALVAVASSLVTVLVSELLRGSRAVPLAARANPPIQLSPTPERDTVHDSLLDKPVVAPSPPRAEATDDTDRFAELERRLASLEQFWKSRRTPVATPAGEPVRGDDLRDLVLDWVAQDRETRRQATELQRREERRKEREFEVSMGAHMMAQEHGLTEWEEAQLATLLFTIEARREEVETGIDPLTDDPTEAERRWAEFDEWADIQYAAQLGEEMVERLFGVE